MRRRSWKTAAKAFVTILEDYYYAPYRATILREQNDEEYLFQLLVFMDMLGIENPVSAYSLELQAVLLEEFHDWHLRTGYSHSPLESISCC